MDAKKTLVDEFTDFIKELYEDKEFKELQKKYHEKDQIRSDFAVTHYEGVPLSYFGTNPEALAKEISESFDEMYKYVSFKAEDLSGDAREIVMAVYERDKKLKEYDVLKKALEGLDFQARVFGRNYEKKDLERIVEESKKYIDISQDVLKQNRKRVKYALKGCGSEMDDETFKEYMLKMLK